MSFFKWLFEKEKDDELDNPNIDDVEDAREV